MAIYAATRDAGDGTYLGIVGPFESEEALTEYFNNPLFEGIAWEIDEPLTPEDYLATFEDD